MSQFKSEGAYHHGDLPVTLMDLALARIADEGTEKLSLRALAREAGVSATAPYRHFPTKRCLLAALATRGFRQLREINESIILSPDDLEESAVRLGMAYIRFAINHATTYQIMFGTVIDDFTAYPELSEAADLSYLPFQRLVEMVLERRPDWDMTPELLGGTMWSAVHGLASLVIFIEARTDEGAQIRPRQALVAVTADQEKALRTLIHGVVVPTD